MHVRQCGGNRLAGDGAAQRLEQRAARDPAHAQCFGVRLARLIARADVPTCPAMLGQARVVHRDVGSTVRQIGNRMAALLHQRSNQLIGLFQLTF